MTPPQNIALLVLLLVCSTVEDAGAEAGDRPSSGGGEVGAALRIVALMGLQASSGTLDRIGEVQRALETVTMPPGVQVLSGERLIRRRDDVIEAEGAADQVPMLREQARAHFLAFEFDTARETLERARQVLIDRHADLLGEETLARVELDLARVLLDLGQLGPARTALHRAARICPDIEPEPDDYPPRLLQVWSEVTAEGDGVEDGPPSLDLTRLASAGRDLQVEYVLSGTTRAGPEQGSVQLSLLLLRSGDDEVAEHGEVLLGEPSSWTAALGPEVTRLLSMIPIEGPPEPEARSQPPRTAYLVLSSPSGAAVAIDGEDQGLTTPALVDSAPGSHRLALSLEGHRPLEIEVLAWNGQTRPIEVELQRGSETRWYRSWWFWTVVGVVVSGAVAGVVTWGVLASQDQPDVDVVVHH